MIRQAGVNVRSASVYTARWLRTPHHIERRADEDSKYASPSQFNLLHNWRRRKKYKNNKPWWGDGTDLHMISKTLSSSTRSLLNRLLGSALKMLPTNIHSNTASVHNPNNFTQKYLLDETRWEHLAIARQYSADNKNRGLARLRKQNKRHRMKPVAPRAALTPTQPGQRNTTAEQQHSCTTHILFFFSILACDKKTKGRKILKKYYLARLDLWLSLDLWSAGSCHWQWVT